MFRGTASSSKLVKSAMRQTTAAAGSRRSRRTVTNLLGGLVSSASAGGNAASAYGVPASSLALFVAVGCLVNLGAVAVASDLESGTNAQQQQESSADSSSSATHDTPYAALQSNHRTYEGVYSATPPIAAIGECPAYGCPLLPRDIAFDAHAKEALESIRALRAASSSTADDDASSVDTAASEEALSVLGSAGGDDHATLTLIGYKGGKMDDQVNQDRAFLVSPYMGQPGRRIVGVFDGHGRGGEYVSDFTVTNLPDHLASKLGGGGDQDKTIVKNADEVKKVLFEAFVEMDRSARDTPEHVTGGCTATVVLQLDDKAYVANAGDSRSIIATYSKSTKETKVVYVTREDKPHLPEERQRVERMGGRVRLPPQPGGTSRVMYRDAVTGGEYGLAMSRSIGDWAAGDVGVIPDPLVDVVDLNELVRGDGGSKEQTCTVSEDGEQECLATPAEVVEGDMQVFAVSATDGLLDYVGIDDIVKHVALGLYDDEEGPHLLSACEALISAAAGGWHRHKQGRYRDDIAISVSKLKW